MPTKADESPKTPDRIPHVSCSRWLRNANGTFEVRYRAKNKPEYVKIANYGIRIRTIQFVIRKGATRVSYSLEFLTPTGPQSQTIFHEDLADEQAFFKVAVAGFAVTAVPKSFALLRECLMADLPDAKREAVVTSLGWFSWQGRPFFAHAGGIIGADSDLCRSEQEPFDGTSQASDIIDVDKACSDVPILAGKHRPVTAIHVTLKENHAHYRPCPPKTKEAAREAMRAVLDLLALGDPNVTYMTVPALFATAVKDPRVGLFLYGETGALKTAYSLLLLSFFVPGAQERDCASFKTTENGLRVWFSATGNVPVVIDDYVQLVGSRNGGDEAKKAENLIRSVVNRTGKDRCAGDGSLRPLDRPRGLPIITGELLPDGLESLRRRTISIPVDHTTFKEATSGPRPNSFDRFQSLAEKGTFATAMGAFIAWAACRLTSLREFFVAPGHEYQTLPRVHPRLIEATEYVVSGAAVLLAFAQDIGACSEEENERHASLAIAAAENVLHRAYRETSEDSPIESFVQLLHSALSSLRCHIEVANVDTYVNSEYAVPLELLGYTTYQAEVTSKDNSAGDTPTHDADHTDDYVEYKTVYRPHGKRIGWLNGTCTDLIPEAALAEANSMAFRSGMSTLPPKKAFGKLLAVHDWISRQAEDRNTCKVRRGDIVLDVWRVHTHRLFEIALRWSQFDIAAYRQMSHIDREEACRTRRTDMLARLRDRVAEFQANGILNPTLVHEDRTDLLIPDPPIEDHIDGRSLSGGKGPSFGPINPLPLPGYDEPDEKEDGLDC